VCTSLRPDKAAPSQFSIWHRYPTLYEINTWVWLSELSRKYGENLTLSRVPEGEWDGIARYGFDAVWLMGVWERSPAGVAIANENKDLVDDFRRALPDFRPDDNKGSAYCVRRYLVDPHLGGQEGLAIARQELAKRGMKLVLDFVPNHVALDHPWVDEHPEYFIRGGPDDLRDDAASYIQRAGIVFARGRDPYFPAWRDVLQLDAFDSGLRKAAIRSVSGIARQCDGIRCDMAMLLLNEIFARTWRGRTGPQPVAEYWTEVIPAVKKEYPDFLFIAEAYWDTEWQLQQLGFDFCYDKRLYERLEYGNAESIRLHLCADLNFQGKLVRFVENHDEPRAAAVFSPGKREAVALMAATLPGIKLFHEGQFEGRTVRLPVFLGRRPDEVVDQGLESFYRKLLDAVETPAFRDGQWSLCGRTGWPGNETFQNVVSWNWLKDDERYLVIVNFGESPAQGRIQIPFVDAGGNWLLMDVISGAIYERTGDEMQSPGLFVDLGPWKYHFFRCRRGVL
jgi:Alpha amylase, catalytic domain